ncbi:alkaline phosphatase family protein [Nocardioides sp. BP30]|uniref:phospholipase C n=1 Tax=Nocardioides sp. BP30 TaxID=3036374 RepID=UPI00246864CA|nr:alkaline phosphatase family protein [Nocardioides sp. BP30]WGL51159.1 alkaline phosphatase family protein [Nocardioides sp. BP30]
MRNPIVRGSRRAKIAGFGIAAAALVGASFTYVSMATADPADNSANTTTPIKHVVVLFDENESYDHYFGTYPNAANTDGVPFTAATGTPLSNNYAKTPSLLKKTTDGGTNPNSTAPFRLTNSQAVTCSQNHNYTPEQKAVSGINGATNTGVPMSTFPENTSGCAINGSTPTNMGYFDGNTVTGLWNYAQNYAMSDNSWADNFGPSTVGALNVVSGQTGNATAYSSTSDDSNPTALTNAGTVSASGFSAITATSTGNTGTVIGDPDPVYDDCADADHTGTSNLVGMNGKNIGDLLNAKGVTWGWFQGGFTPTTKYTGSGYAKCDSTHTNIAGASDIDYSPHHNPFAYYKSTSNPHHYPGTPGVAIGANDPTNDTTKTGANHQYDLSAFDMALANNQLPAVSYLKAAQYEDAHPGYSDPVDEQRFVTDEINKIELSPEWSSTAIVIAYDDSDGWYDHQLPTIINGSNTSDDVQVCNTAANANSPIGGIADRCGPSQRLPFLVISPYSKQNYIDHTQTSQASVVKFIESNWSLDPIGGGSFDTTAGTITGMLDFAKPQQRSVLLNQNGTVARIVSDKTTTGGGTTTSPAPTVARITKIGVVGVDKKVKVKKKIKASFLFAATGTVAGPVKLYDGKKVIASGNASQNVATLRFKLKTKGLHKLHLSFLGTRSVKAFTGSTFKVHAK